MKEDFFRKFNSSLKRYENELSRGKRAGEIIGTTAHLVAPALVGNEGRRARFWPIGQCTFFKDSRCEIHNLKPIEGRIGDHRNRSNSSDVHFSIMKLWDSPEGELVADMWRNECKETWWKGGR